MTIGLPLISCITPTYNRRRFLPAAVAQFLRQDWPSKELIVVDDGTDCVRDVVPDDPRIVYIRLDRRATIGRKRNIACDRARGEVVAHWDDDDWHATHRLRLQAQALLASHADVCGITKLLFCNPEEERAWEFAYHGTAPWVGGSSMVYRRAAWAKTPFPDCDVGEDARFAASRPRSQVLVLTDGSFHVGRVHAANVTPKIAMAPAWRALPIETIRDLLGGDWPSFASAESPPDRARLLASCIMPTADRRAFVALGIDHFRSQDYQPAELIVVDSGREPVEDLCRDDPRIRYVRAPTGASIGAQRNVACGEARGDVVVHWDDDDWYAPDRLRRQLEPIASGRADVTGLDGRYVWNISDGSFWTIAEDLHKRMFVGNVHGGTLAYRRSRIGSSLRYDNVSLAEDAALLTRMLRAGARLERVPNAGTFVYVRHASNAWRFEAGSFLGRAGWTRADPPPALPPETIGRYRAIGARAPEAGPVAAAAPVAVDPPAPEARTCIDCLGNVGISLPPLPARFDRCVAIVASESYADFLDGALLSLERFGGLGGVPRVVLVSAPAPRCEAIAARHGATVAACATMRGPGPWLKGALYSITHAISAKQYLCLDADVLVVDGLASLFEMHAALPRGRALVAAESSPQSIPDLRSALESLYLTAPAEAERLLAPYPDAASSRDVINDGVFVADFDALAAVDEILRDAAALRIWATARRDVWWRTKGALNVALAQARAITLLGGEYNVQLHVDPAVPCTVDGRPGAHSRGRRVRILHFNGRGKNLYSSWRRTLFADNPR
jgi:glycosyltransferase involved in cell wall biosynthesis